jgi:hypothetical protein
MTLKEGKDILQITNDNNEAVHLEPISTYDNEDYKLDFDNDVVHGEDPDYFFDNINNVLCEGSDGNLYAVLFGYDFDKNQYSPCNWQKIISLS